jgi:hypothetical protein
VEVPGKRWLILGLTVHVKYRPSYQPQSKFPWSLYIEIVRKRRWLSTFAYGA